MRQRRTRVIMFDEVVGIFWRCGGEEWWPNRASNFLGYILVLAEPLLFEILYIIIRYLFVLSIFNNVPDISALNPAPCCVCSYIKLDLERR